MAQKKAAQRSSSASSRKKKTRASREGAERYNKAAEAFERALKTFHKGDNEKALSQFESIIVDFPDEKEMRDHARAYVAICQRRLKSPAGFSPQTQEELVTRGIFLHNAGAFDEAIQFLSKAVEMDPKNEHAHYCLAAAYARVGDSRSASRHLKRAIQFHPYNRVLARSDADFDALRDDPAIAQVFSEEQPGGTL